MVRLAKHRKNLRGGAPSGLLNLNYENTTVGPMGHITPPPEKTVENIMREMRRAHGIQANTPTAMAEELSRRHAPVVASPIVEKKPGFLNRLFGRTRKNTTGEKKPGFFNRLFGRTQKNSGEKKPGFFNRLFGRTKKVQPQLQPLAIQPPPSPPQLAPARAPPTPPAISAPTTPNVGPKAFTAPRAIQIPTRFNLEPSTDPAFLSKTEFEKRYVQEDFDKCVLRVAWYLKQRLAGKTHDELLPNLQRPGSMMMTKDDLEELRQTLLPLKGHPDNKEFTAKKEELFGPNIDKEIDAWEHGYPVNPIALTDLQTDLAYSNDETEKQRLRIQIQELERRQKDIMRQYCRENTCILYKDTPQEVMAQGNVGNGLYRYLLNFYTEPDYLQWRTNVQRAVYCGPKVDCYSLYTFEGIKNTTSMTTLTTNSYRPANGEPNFFKQVNVIDPSTDLLCVDDIRKYVQLSGIKLEKQFFMSMRYIIDLFVGGNVYFITPNFAVSLQQQYPELFLAAFGPYVQWEKLSKATALRMLTVQYFTAINLALETDNPMLAKKVYETYPQPAFGLIQGYTKDKLMDFSRFFKQVQQREGIQPMSLIAYIQQLKKLKNIQVRKTIQPSKVLGSTWTNTKFVQSANTVRRNAAREAIAKARLENSSIVPYNQRFLSAPSYNMTKHARNNAKTKNNLQRRLNAGFGVPASSGIKASAYETIPNW